MKKNVYLMLSLFLIVSCKTVNKETPTLIKEIKIDSIEKKEVSIPKVIIPLEEKISCSEDININLDSRILCKIEDLGKLESNYNIMKQEKITFEKSLIFYGTRRLKKLTPHKIENLYDLSKMISEIQYCYIKGTTDLGGKMYPRARIEEIIFKSEDCASKFIKTLNESTGDSGYLKELFNKSPHSLFREQNRIYYISSGGLYMMKLHNEIENLIRNKTCE